MANIVAAFVRDGLSSATKVMCVTESIPPDQLSAELSERGVPVADALPTTQLMIFSTDESWLVEGDLTAPKMIELLGRYVDEADNTHPRAVAAAVYHEDPVLRICRQHMPPGIRLAGEIDFRHVDELTLALNEALQLDRDFQVNLARLRFVDAAAASAIAHAAQSLPGGRVMTIRCGGTVLRVLRLVGATDLPSVRVVSPYGER